MVFKQQKYVEFLDKFLFVDKKIQIKRYIDALFIRNVDGDIDK